MRTIGVCLAILVGLVITINAVFMVASPRAWFRLPSWLGAWGSLSKYKHATGPGAIEVRLTGAIMLGAVGWILYDMLLRR